MKSLNESPVSAIGRALNFHPKVLEKCRWRISGYPQAEGQKALIEHSCIGIGALVIIYTIFFGGGGGSSQS